MKTLKIKFGLILLMAAGISLSSCEPTTDGAALLGASMVNVDDEGTTTVNNDVFKSATTVDGVLTSEQEEWLKFMREEEKLARDLYIALGEDYTVPVFKNIPRAEDNHMNAVLTLLTAYSIEDPASEEPGVFNNADLQTLYNTLLAQGKTSLVEALKVGALVEETDILDLADVYNLEPGDDLTALAEALMLGSRNHLRAFVRVLKINGVEYQPVALDADDYLEIITSGWERGTGLCIGNQINTGSNYCNGSGRGFRGGR